MIIARRVGGTEIDSCRVFDGVKDVLKVEARLFGGFECRVLADAINNATADSIMIRPHHAFVIQSSVYGTIIMIGLGVHIERHAVSTAIVDDWRGAILPRVRTGFAGSSLCKVLMAGDKTQQAYRYGQHPFHIQLIIYKNKFFLPPLGGNHYTEHHDTGSRKVSKKIVNSIGK